MANQITDGRTNVFQFESLTGVVDLTGAAAGTLDAEIFYEGSNSVAEYCTNTRAGLLYDSLTAQNWANNTFYLLFNSGIAGLLDTKANGGVTVRFCGATVTDWFEVYVAGSDNYPSAFSGGWVQFVIDIETAYTAAVTNADAETGVNGTPPATSAIRYIGVSFVTGGTMPRMADNTWLDQIARLPDGSAGIIIEGSNAGITPWTWDDVVTAASITNKWATAKTGAGGSVVLNTPVQFGINDLTNHEFDDDNVTILWEDHQYLPDDLYAITALMGTGANFIRGGIKSGIGNDATGAQGWNIQAAAAGARWSMDFSDINVNEVSLYGCSFIHGESFNFANVDIDLATILFNDCTSADVTNAKIVQASVVAANTVAGVAFMTTDDIGDIVNSTFEYSAGHAIELTTPITASQTSLGNKFTGYLGTPGSNLIVNSGSTGAAIYNNAAGAITISITSGGNIPSVRNGAGATTTVNANTSITLDTLQNNTEVTIYDAGDGSLIAEIEDVVGNQYVFSDAQANVVDIFIHHISYYRADILGYVIPTNDATIPISQIFDPNYQNPV